MTILILFAASLVIRWACLAITWTEAAWAHSQMLRGVARAKHAHKLSLRSRTLGGSGTGDPDPNRSPVRAGDALSPSARHLMEGPGLSAVVPPARPGPPPNPGGRDSVVPPDSRGHRAPQTPAGAALPHRHASRPLDRWND